MSSRVLAIVLIDIVGGSSIAKRAPLTVTSGGEACEVHDDRFVDGGWRFRHEDFGAEGCGDRRDDACVGSGRGRVAREDEGVKFDSGQGAAIEWLAQLGERAPSSRWRSIHQASIPMPSEPASAAASIWSIRRSGRPVMWGESLMVS